jgi:predicted nucleic acid-binding protein
MIVVDTNVLSELGKPLPSPEVLAWFAAQPIAELYSTSVTEAEVYIGIELMPAGKRREAIQSAADTAFATLFAGRILPFDLEAAQAFGRIVADRRRIGRPIEIMDAQIAAIALSRSATIATRDATDFAHCGVRIVDPWSSRVTR